MSIENSNIFSISSSNAQMPVGQSGFISSGLIPLKYNGVDVYYVPKSFVDKGFVSGTAQYQYPKSGGYIPSLGDATWYGNLAFLDTQLHPFMKPATLSQDFIEEAGKKTTNPNSFQHEGRTYTYTFDMRNVPDFQNGYIVEKAAFDAAGKRTGANYSGIAGSAIAYNPSRVPQGMGTAPNGQPAYIGYTADTSGYSQRYDLFYINQSQPWGYYDFKWSKSIFNEFPALRILDVGLRILNPWYNLGRAIGDFAFNDGKIGDVALALVGVNTPNASGVTAAKGTMFEIPQIANATSKIADFYTAQLGLSPTQAAAAARVTFDTGLSYLANGQDFSKAFTNAAASYVGSAAGAKLASSLGDISKDTATIVSKTTAATTKAVLLNQDVEKAALTAFVQTSVPLALDGALKQTGLTLSQAAKDAISSAAITAALGGDVNAAIQSAVLKTLTTAATDKVADALVKQGVVDSKDPAVMAKVTKAVDAYLAGSSVEQILAGSLLDEAQKFAQANLGTWLRDKTTDPEVYALAQVAKRDAELRPLVKELDPDFNEAEYRRLYGLQPGVSALEHWLDKGQFQGLATNAEDYVAQTLGRLPEYDKDFYAEEYNYALNAAKAGDLNKVQQVAAAVDRSWTTDDEARQYLIDAYAAAGLTDYEPTAEEIKSLTGKNEVFSYTAAQNYSAIGATTFDGSSYGSAQEAAAAAKAAGYNTFEAPDGNTYQVPTSPIEEANVRASVEEKKTFSEAFAEARAKLGAGKTFTWNGKQYTTNILPKDVFDASKASSVTAAATLAYANGKDKFIGPDGKQYTIPNEAKAVLDNSLNQSQAETNRLLAQAVKPAQDEYPAETQRLMESGTRGTMDVIGAMTAQALGTTQRGVANLLMNAGKTYAAITGDLDFDNALVQVGKEIEQYAQQRDIYGLDVQKNRLAQAMEQANETDSWLEKTKIIGSAIKNNSIGFFDVAGSEVVEEIPETVLQIGIALATGGTSLAASGAIAAISAAGSVVETFGNTVEDAYKKAKQQGDSEDVAMQKAYLSGVIGTTIEMGTELVADKALLAPFLEKVSGSLISTATGYLTSTAIGAASEFAAGISQSYATQYIVNPETASLSKAATDGIFEMYIGGVAQGALGLPGYAMQGATVIGKDYYGNNVTLDQAASGVIVDSSTINPNTVIGEAGDGNIVTLGSAMYSMPSYQFDMATLETYVPQVFSNNNIVVGKDALGNNITLGGILAGADGDVDVRGAIADFASIDADDRIEAQTAVIEQAMRDAGYTSFKPEDVQALINPTNPTGTQSFIDAATTYADPRVTDAEEARQMLLAAGYTNPTNEEIQQFVGETPELQSTTAISEYVAPRMVTEEEARQFFESQGYTPTEEEVAQFVRQGADILQDQVQQDLVQYVDPRQVTQEEAEKFFRDLGYDFTPEEVAQFVQQGPNVLQDAVAGNVSTYVDPRMVDEQEVRDAYAALGFNDALQQDIDALTGQYSEAELEARAREQIPIATYNATQAQIASTEQSILNKIAENEAAGMSRDQAMQEAIDSVAQDLGTTRDALLEQIGTTEAALSSEIETAYNSLSEGQKQLADQLVQQGLDLGEAITVAKSELQAQIEQTAQILGKPAQQVTQGDIDLVTQMIGQQDQNLAYDVNRDGQINQADVDILNRQLSNIDEPWNPAEGTIWAPTGLYAENAVLRQQQEQQYKDLMAAQEAARQEAARQAEAQRRLTLQGQARVGIQNLVQQLPQFYQQSMTTTKPIYAGQTNFVDINAPLQVGGIFDVWGTTANQQRQTKMASGGYLNMQGEPESWEDILRMLNK